MTSIIKPISTNSLQSRLGPFPRPITIANKFLCRWECSYRGEDIVWGLVSSEGNDADVGRETTSLLIGA